MAPHDNNELRHSFPANFCLYTSRVSKRVLDWPENFRNDFIYICTVFNRQPVDPNRDCEIPKKTFIATVATFETGASTSLNDSWILVYLRFCKVKLRDSVTYIMEINCPTKAPEGAHSIYKNSHG